MPTDSQLTHFILNSALTVMDAAIGYHLGPRLVQRALRSSDEAARAIRSIPSLLAASVIVAMFCTCLAYFHQHPLLATIITITLLLDMSVQILLCRRPA
jgi:hypothetical protein